MSKLNPYAPVLKKIRKKEVEDRRIAKKASIEKAKSVHKLMKIARQKRKAAGTLGKVDAKAKVSKVAKKDLGKTKK